PVTAPRALPPHTDAVTALSLSADGNTVLSASADKTVRVSTFANGQQVRQLIGPNAAVNAVALAPSGALVAGGTADNRLVVWHAASPAGKPVAQYVAPGGPVNAVSFHPQSTQLLTGGGDGLLKLWAMPPVPTRSLPHADAVTSSALTADGKR